MEIANTEEENPHIFWKTCGIFIRFSGMMLLMIILQVTKKYALPFFWKTHFWKNHREEVKLTLSLSPTFFRIKRDAANKQEKLVDWHKEVAKNCCVVQCWIIPYLDGKKKEIIASIWRLYYRIDLFCCLVKFLFLFWVLNYVDSNFFWSNLELLQPKNPTFKLIGTLWKLLHVSWLVKSLNK